MGTRSVAQGLVGVPHRTGMQPSASPLGLPGCGGFGSRAARATPSTPVRGIELWAVCWQGDRRDPVWPGDVTADMRPAIIQHDGHALSREGLPPLASKHLEAGAVQLWEDEAESLPGGRLHRSLQPEPCILVVGYLERFSLACTVVRR